MFRAKRRLATLVSAALLFTLCMHAPTASRASNPCPNTDAFNGITGLSLWLRADCVTGNAADPADNSTVNTWTDLSGSGNNATRQSGTPTFQSDASQNLAAIIGGLVVILTRVISIQFDLHLPKFNNQHLWQKLLKLARI
jgi:hypothetical protein